MLTLILQLKNTEERPNVTGLYSWDTSSILLAHHINSCRWKLYVHLLWSRDYRSWIVIYYVSSCKLWGKTFKQYLLPDEEISHYASATTFISFNGIVLYKDGEKLDAVPLPEALVRFSNWIKGFNSPILVSHSAKSVTSVVFMNNVSKSLFEFWSHMICRQFIPI